LALASFGMAWASADAPQADPATLEMAALLKERAARVDPAKLPFVVNDLRAEGIAEQLAWPRPTDERLELRYNYALELVKAGRIQDALEAFDALEADAEKSAPGAWVAHRSTFLLQKAVAYMRLAEEQNCHLSNNRDACLFPIQGGGVHQLREGSTRAVDLLERLLADAPDNLEARWLLNVAHMTLGSYPAGVPVRQLIRPTVFASEYPLPRFDNVAKEAGVDVFGLAGGAVMDDFDNDGRLDLMISGMGLEDQLRLFHNKGDGTFEDQTNRAGLTGEVGGLNMIQADYDNDGFVDVLVLRGGWMQSEGHFPMSLLRNNGNGTFTDVTKAAGLLSHLAPTQTAVWLDYDGDGRLDLFVGNESSPDNPSEVNPCELFRNNGDGTFTNVAPEVGADVVGFVKGVVSADYDNDGRPDLYLSLQGGNNLLLHNDGPAGGTGWHFTDVAAKAHVTEPTNSFGAFFFDYDNDGWPDLFVAGYGGFVGVAMAKDVAADYLGLPTKGDRGRLYHNKGDGTFEDVTVGAGLYKVIPAMGLNFGDLDNDGWLDFYLGTGNPEFSSLIPKRMFRNAGGLFFQDVTTAGDFGHLQKGHAIAFGDIDNDGDQDVFEVMGGAYTADKAYSALYENPGNANHWVTLELEGVRSNRRAIGARVKVTVETRAGTTRAIHRTVGSGGSFGASPLRQEIGLGDARRITSIEIFWPVTGQLQRLDGIPLDRHYRIREGVDAAVKLDRPSFRIPRPRGAPSASTGQAPAAPGGPLR
jgi:FG-GAP-like repeat/ASPIC and UnbV